MSTKTITLEQLVEAKGGVTLKAIAFVLGVPSNRLYSVAKQPKEGEVYDAKVYNWDAIQRFCERRLDESKGYSTLEELIDLAVEADKEFKANDGRRGRGAATIETFEVDGVEWPKRKYETFEMSSGKFICLRDDANVYKIVLQTLTHTVLVPVKDMEGTVASEDVKVVSNKMLNHKGISPMSLDKAIEERFAPAE